MLHTESYVAMGLIITILAAGFAFFADWQELRKAIYRHREENDVDALLKAERRSTYHVLFHFLGAWALLAAGAIASELWL